MGSNVLWVVIFFIMGLILGLLIAWFYLPTYNTYLMTISKENKHAKRV
jgi:hypothetical protein